MMYKEKQEHPGPIILFGSGETLPAAGPAYDFIAEQLDNRLDISILETPAGFQNNSENVARDVANFINRRLSNFNPNTHLIPARAKNSALSPDNPEILKPLLTSNWVFMGPGSPTYTIRQLQESLALKYLYALHSLGAALTFSSAAVLAISALTLPIYEIYKVGEDLHWVQGLDFLGPYGQKIVFVPHWDNKDGGENLDTSRCFMGMERFEKLLRMLPEGITIVGIDEQTSLSINFGNLGLYQIFGKGEVTVMQKNMIHTFSKGIFSQNEIGIDLSIPERQTLADNKIWETILQARKIPDTPTPQEIVSLSRKRESARLAKNWDESDRIRIEINNLGWDVQDTPDGPMLNQK